MASMEKIAIYNSRRLNASTIWILFLFLGWSYGSMGSIGKQVLYYLTGGGLLLWTIYRLFTLNGAIKKYNRNIALEIGIESDDLMRLGLV